jgi:hypothetical protein
VTVSAEDIAGVPKRGESARLFLWIGGFAIVLFGVIAFFVWPRGKRIGEIDLLADDASTVVAVKAGARLVFRMDVGPGGTTAEYKLRESKITIAVEDGASSTCDAYPGAAMSESPSGWEGMVLSCEIRLSKSGDAKVRATAQWAQGFRPSKAMLEVRMAE